MLNLILILFKVEFIVFHRNLVLGIDPFYELQERYEESFDI